MSTDELRQQHEEIGGAVTKLISERAGKLDDREALGMIDRVAAHRMTLESAARKLARGR